jgi:hypothetical protein
MFVNTFRVPYINQQCKVNGAVSRERCTIIGSVKDATGAAVVDAAVSIENPVSVYSRVTMSDSEGRYRFTNVPLTRITSRCR